MAARKLAQEIDKCFKKVGEGVAEFESIYEKIEQSTNPAQKEKLEDQLKREIKKLQRLRDNIKSWAASNDIKDKGPLLEHRRLIETQMEKFKAVEKAMKTKAYSKEGLSAAAKLDPKEQAKIEASEFLSTMVSELEEQIEMLEAEGESIQATMKKGKGQSQKAERIAEIERVIERHKWHQGKLELIRRSLENGGVEAEQVTDLEDSIKYYVAEGTNSDFMEDDTMYDELSLDEDEDAFGMNQDADKVSSQDTQSVQEEAPESEVKAQGKQRAVADAAAAASARRPSGQLKSPLPTLATVHTPLQTISNGAPNNSGMKPATVPNRPELKYASAAAAAADKANVGIAPLPPPPSATPAPAIHAKTSLPSTPIPAPAQMAATQNVPPQAERSTPGPAPAAGPAHTPAAAAAVPATASTPTPAMPPAASIPTAAAPGLSSRVEITKAGSRSRVPGTPDVSKEAVSQSNGASNGIRLAEAAEEESIYHLPASLQDLVESFEATKAQPFGLNSTESERMQVSSLATKPEALDADAPLRYHPDVPFYSHAQFPREPLVIFEDPRLYQRIEPDTLFYVFYYKQGTYQQYLAAKALKDQSWRFHKQYQTWFQRHEEPKSITEEFEQGTYRFFDYESTWMNRRKADFKFAYKFLEDEV